MDRQPKIVDERIETDGEECRVHIKGPFLSKDMDIRVRGKSVVRIIDSEIGESVKVLVKEHLTAEDIKSFLDS